MSKVWVLTTEYNDYDQHGEYFVSVFKNLPTKEQISNKTGFIVDSPTVEHILSGGGRIEYEHQWYYLIEVELE